MPLPQAIVLFFVVVGFCFFVLFMSALGNSGPGCSGQWDRAGQNGYEVYKR